MPLPVRSLPTVQNWDCHGCTDCCRTYAVAVSDEERRRLAEQAWSLEPDMRGVETIVRDEQSGGYRLNHTSDGTCVFLTSEGRCRIHARFGAAAKPMACRIYPFVLVNGGNHWRVGMRYGCPSVTANNGRPLSVHDGDLAEYAALMETAFPVTQVEQPPPELQAGQLVDWPDLIRFMRTILDRIDDASHPIERRLRHVDAISRLCRQSRFEQVRGPRLGEYLQVVSAAMVDDVIPDAAAIRRPGWVARNLFRQQLAIYCRKDNGPHAGIASRGRITRIRAAWRFARWKGKIPRLHGLIPDEATFAAAEVPVGTPLDAETTELLARYYHVKVLSLQFCGATNFGRGFWDGLDSLLLTFPAILWLSRVLTNRERSRVEAISLAIRIVDDHFGYNRFLGVSRQTWANRTMAERGDVSRLIAWYTR